MISMMEQRFYDRSVALLPELWRRALSHPALVYVPYSGTDRNFRSALVTGHGTAGRTLQDRSGVDRRIYWGCRYAEVQTFLHEATHALDYLVETWDPQAKCGSFDPELIEIFNRAKRKRLSIDAFVDEQSASYSLSDEREFQAQLVSFSLTDDEEPAKEPYQHPLAAKMWGDDAPEMLARAQARFEEGLQSAIEALSVGENGRIEGVRSEFRPRLTFKFR